MALDTGATANLVRSCWLEHHNQLLERRGFQRVSTYPSKATIRSGDWRLLEVHHAADIPAGIVGDTSKFAACVLDAEIPA